MEKGEEIKDHFLFPMLMDKINIVFLSNGFFYCCIKNEIVFIQNKTFNILFKYIVKYKIVDIDFIVYNNEILLYIFTEHICYILTLELKTMSLIKKEYVQTKNCFFAKVFDKENFCIYNGNFSFFNKENINWKQTKQEIEDIPTCFTKNIKNIFGIHCKKKSYFIELETMKKICKTHIGMFKNISWNKEQDSFLISFSKNKNMLYRKELNGEYNLCGVLETKECTSFCTHTPIFCVISKKKTKKQKNFFCTYEESLFDNLLKKKASLIFHYCKGKIWLWCINNLNEENSLVKIESLISSSPVIFDECFYVNTYFEQDCFVKDVFFYCEKVFLWLENDNRVFTLELETENLLKGYTIAKECFIWTKKTDSLCLFQNKAFFQQKDLFWLLDIKGEKKHCIKKNENEQIYQITDYVYVSIIKNHFKIYQQKEGFCFLAKDSIENCNKEFCKIYCTGVCFMSKIRIFFWCCKEPKIYDFIYKTGKLVSICLEKKILLKEAIPINKSYLKDFIFEEKNIPFCFGYSEKKKESCFVLLWNNGINGNIESETVNFVDTPLKKSCNLSGCLSYSTNKELIIFYSGMSQYKTQIKEEIKEIFCGYETRNTPCVCVLTFSFVFIFFKREDSWINGFKDYSFQGNILEIRPGFIFYEKSQVLFRKSYIAPEKIEIKENKNIFLINTLLNKKRNINIGQDLFLLTDGKSSMSYYFKLISKDNTSSNDICSWKVFEDFGYIFWIDKKTLEQKIHRIAMFEYKNKNFLLSCLFYIALGKKQIAVRLLKETKNEKEQRLASLLEKDFSVQETKNIGTKNAFSLLRKKNLLGAAAVFLASDSLKDCVFVCRRHIESIQLSLVISFLVEKTVEKTFNKILHDSLKEAFSWDLALFEKVVIDINNQETFCSPILKEKDPKKSFSSIILFLFYLEEKKGSSSPKKKALIKQIVPSAVKTILFLCYLGYNEQAHGVLDILNTILCDSFFDILPLNLKSCLFETLNRKEELSEVVFNNNFDLFEEKRYKLENELLFSALLLCSKKKVKDFCNWNEKTVCRTENDIFEFSLEKEQNQLINNVECIGREKKIILVENIEQKYPQKTIARKGNYLCLKKHPKKPFYFISEKEKKGVSMFQFGEEKEQAFFSINKQFTTIPEISPDGTVLGIYEKEIGCVSIWSVEKEEKPIDLFCCDTVLTSLSFIDQTLFLCCGESKKLFLYDRLLPKQSSLVGFFGQLGIGKKKITLRNDNSYSFFVSDDENISLFDIRKINKPIISTKTDFQISSVTTSNQFLFLGTTNESVLVLKLTDLTENYKIVLSRNKNYSFLSGGMDWSYNNVSYLKATDDFLFFCCCENGIRRIPVSNINIS